MKRIALLASLLIANIATAQEPAFQNEADKTVYSTAGSAAKISVDSKGRTKIGSIVPGTAASSLGKAESSTHTSGDVGVEALGVRNTSLNALAAQGEYAPLATGTFGQNLSTLVIDAAVSTAATPIRQEDSAAASGDALVGVAGVVNTGFSVPAPNGDYTSIALGQFGQPMTSLVYDSAIAVGLGGMTQEDNALSNGDAGVKVLVQSQDPLTVDQGTNGDAGFLKTDRVGRTITTLAPAGESFYACTGAITTNTNTTIKAAVASNRIYVTSVQCSNTSATGTRLTITDGSGGSNMATGSVGPSLASPYIANFPVPLRGTSNTALNVNTETTGASVVCCAQGYISVN